MEGSGININMRPNFILLKNPASARPCADAKRIPLALLGDCCGGAGAGVLLMFAITITAFLLICEFYYAFTVKQGIDIELSRAANTAVDLAMSDAHRQDRLSEMDVSAAYDRFYDYLYNDMNLSSRLEAHSRNGEVVYSLEINSVSIEPSPPSIRATATVIMHPAFLGRAIPAPIRFTVRCTSTNRRKE